MGLSVRTFASALEFLENFPLDQRGCVVADYDMPGMTGLQLIENLRRRGSALPVIIITGRGDAALEQRVKAAGGLKMLYKPVDGLELVGLVEQALAAL
jgi:FixJ family two-component response regulator